MSKTSVTTTTTIPTVENWSDFEQRTFYKGVNIVKGNKSTAVPKDGTNPLCYYVNKNGIKGAWYSIDDVISVPKMSQEDKNLVKSLETQRTDIYKEYRKGILSKVAFDELDSELAETVATIQKQYS